jgi:hypothetical protein
MDGMNHEFSLFHGDFNASNILIGENDITKDMVIRLIDPRGKFGSTNFYGTIEYDLAKFQHSIMSSYDFIINDRFQIYENVVTFPKCHAVFYDEFKKRVQEFGYKQLSIDAVEVGQWFSMIHRHADSLKRQAAMFLTGMELLNDLYKQL